jgi:hypothetical protein
MKRRQSWQTKSSGKDYASNQASTSTPHKANKSQARFRACQPIARPIQPPAQGDGKDTSAKRWMTRQATRDAISPQAKKTKTLERISAFGDYLATEVFFDREDKLLCASTGRSRQHAQQL